MRMTNEVGVGLWSGARRQPVYRRRGDDFRGVATTFSSPGHTPISRRFAYLLRRPKGRLLYRTKKGDEGGGAATVQQLSRSFTQIDLAKMSNSRLESLH